MRLKQFASRTSYIVLSDRLVGRLLTGRLAAVNYLRQE